ncbi:head decoration protein [Bradyrhizobium sp. HKCCYLS2038]|uniref:head decoration protein n=1 Tax=Bradyrhizobium sp. HKCCYLS2038 TaxID=3420764 RepID=UPI003EB943F5
MSVLYENPHDGNFILSEDDEGRLSRDNIAIASGAGVLLPGTVLGKISASGKFVPSPLAATDGSEVAAAILVGRVDAANADAHAVGVMRHAEVNRFGLLYDHTVDDDAKKSAKWDQLRAAGIVVR